MPWVGQWVLLSGTWADDCAVPPVESKNRGNQWKSLPTMPYRKIVQVGQLGQRADTTHTLCMYIHTNIYVYTNHGDVILRVNELAGVPHWGNLGHRSQGDVGQGGERGRGPSCSYRGKRRVLVGREGWPGSNCCLLGRWSQVGTGGSLGGLCVCACVRVNVCMYPHYVEHHSGSIIPMFYTTRLTGPALGKRGLEGGGACMPGGGILEINCMGNQTFNSAHTHTHTLSHPGLMPGCRIPIGPVRDV